MALKEHFLLMILASLLIGISSSLAWNPTARRGYDLERGPVFYEAYYPDSNEEQRSNYQEKRYFDRGAVFERTYQIPPEGVDYQAESVLRVNDYQNVPEKLPETPNYRGERGMPENGMRSDRMNDFHSAEQYQGRDAFPVGMVDSSRSDKRYNPFPGLSRNSLGSGQSLGIKEISSIARRAISRDLENWSMIENYLDRAAKYQDQGGNYRGREIAQGAPLAAYESLAGTLRDTADERIARENAQSIMMQRDSPLLGTLENRAAAPGRNSLATYETNRYDNQRLNNWQSQPRSESMAKGPSPVSTQPINHTPQEQSTINSYPPENIFEPRPQIIKYVLSKTAKATDAKVQGTSTKEIPKESVPRNYGDNLIRDEIKKSDDPVVTSIEVSEVPRHKTRHHHGEWPRRDYSHRHSNR